MSSSFTCFVKLAMANQTNKWEDYWLQVQGNWLVFSKKVGNTVSYLYPLNLINIADGSADAHYHNVLYIETAQKCGNHKFYISMTNRIEAIQLYQTLTSAKEQLKAAISNKELPNSVDSEITIGGFMKKSKTKHTAHLDPAGFTYVDQKQVTQVIPFASIISMSPKEGDSNCTNKFIITYEEQGSTTQKEFNCTERNQMTEMIMCYIANCN